MDKTKQDLNTDSLIMNSKLKLASQASADGHTMDSFQDGGHNNQERSRANFLSNLEGTNNHMNSADMNNYSQHGPVNTTDSYSKMNDNSSGPPPMPNYNAAFNNPRANFGMSDQQHGVADFQPQHAQFSQFNQQNVRPGFGHNSRNNSVQGRPGMGQTGAVNMGAGNFNHGPQRMMSGPNIQQQGGPTPTLNQLLTNSNATQRYQGAGGYNEYGINQSKSGHDMANNSGFNSQNWSGQQRQPSNPYQQQSMQGNQPFRNQISACTI